MFNMKHLSATTMLALAAGPYLSSAAPMRRQASSNDVLVLQFANVLEQLETSFYGEALQLFQPNDFLDAGFSSAQVVIQEIDAIGTDEATHTSILQQELVSLNEEPLICQFDFSSALSSVSEMLTVARLVENVGVGAYLGAAGLISDPTILTAAASIATVESRHQTMLNIFNNGEALPNPFDLALTPQEVLALAGSFISSGCDLGLTSNLPLVIITEEVTISSSLSFSWEGMPSSIDNLFCQMLVGGQPVSISLPISECVVPSGIQGPVAVFITNDNQPLVNDPLSRSDSSVIAGPTMVFIDTVQQQISAALLNPGSSISGSSASGSSISGSSGSSSSESSSSSISGSSNSSSSVFGGADSSFNSSSASVISSFSSATVSSGGIATSTIADSAATALIGSATTSVAMFTPPISTIPIPTATSQ